jgi:hypothetical protein
VSETNQDQQKVHALRNIHPLPGTAKQERSAVRAQLLVLERMEDHLCADKGPSGSQPRMKQLRVS